MVGFALLFLLALCHGPVYAQTIAAGAAFNDVAPWVEPFPNSTANIDEALKESDQTKKRVFALEVGPKLIELKGIYLEKRRPDDSLSQAPGVSASSGLGSYVDLSAVSSQLGGRLIGEGELAYSTLGPSLSPDQQPFMTRIGIKGNWGKARYGLSYRSFGSGFVAANGARAEHARREDQLWAEYDFGVFRLRGDAGETREEHSTTSQITLTRTAATSVALHKPLWNASLVSGYSVTEQEPLVNQKSLAWTNGLALALRPAASLALEPHLGFKQEWDSRTGLKTETASAAFGWSCALVPNFRLTGRTAFSQMIGADPSKQGSSLNTSAALNWNLGKTFLGEPSLSLQVDYVNELRANASVQTSSRVAGMMRFRLAGF